AVGLTIIADKLGRRPVLIVATLFFSAVTFLTGFATSFTQLLVLRFIAGIGMGSIIPNATALIGEYSPRSRRITLMMNISVAFTAGGAVSGFISTLLIPNFGWRSMFFFGGAVPLVIGMAMALWLPESLQFLATIGGNNRRIGSYLKQIQPSAIFDNNAVYVSDEGVRHGVPVVHLFREGRTLGTILLWVINFMNLLNLYFLSSWLPTVVRDAGYSTRIAVLVGT